MKRMIVDAATLDELRQAKADRLAQYEESSAIRKEQEREYDKAWKAEANGIKSDVYDKIKSQMSNSFMENLEVNVDPGWGDGYYRISIEYGQSSIHDEGISLSWRWSANVGKDGLNKESTSWSNFKATSMDQIDNLKESIRCVELLVSMTDEEWISILKQNTNYDDYVTEPWTKRPDTSDIDSEMVDAALQEAVANQEKFSIPTNKGRYFRDSLLQPISVSNKQVNVMEYSAKTGQTGPEYRISKDKFLNMVDLSY